MRVVCLPRGWGEEERGADLCMERFTPDPPESDPAAEEGAGPLGPHESAKSATSQTPDFSKPAGGRA